MGFRCRMCGTCCMQMGDYIVIGRQTGPFTFEGESVSTGTPFSALVDEDKRELFLDTGWIRDHPSACRFLRPAGDHVLCTIHETSPAQCRFYRCVVMRISRPDGTPAGTVTGTLALHSEDPVLRGIWEQALSGLPDVTGDSEDKLRRIVESHGYRVE